jgi:putative SOS response-associated peptidase YedK
VTTCIITTAANALMTPIHVRMPVILEPAAWDGWLTPEKASMEALKALLGPCAADGMAAYPVSTAVNRAGWRARS